MTFLERIERMENVVVEMELAQNAADLHRL
jgi:hypothetical protein